MARRILRSLGCFMLFAVLVPNLAGCGGTPAPDANKKPAPDANKKPAPDANKKPASDANKKPKMVWAYLKIKAVEPSVWPGSQNKVDLAEFQSYKSDVFSEIKSDFVIAKVLDDKAVQNVPSIKAAGLDAGQWLADRLVVENPEGSEVIKIGLPDDADHDVNKIVDAVVNAFMDEVVNKERTEKLIRRDQLEKRLDVYKALLAAKRNTLHEMSSQIEGPSKSQDLITQANLSISKAKWNKATEQATAAELELAHAKAYLSNLQAIDPSNEAAEKAVDSANIDVEFWTKEVSSAKAEIAALAVELRKADTFNSDLDQLSDEVRQLRNVTNDMDESLIEMNFNLDAPPRVEKLGDAHTVNDAADRGLSIPLANP